MAKTTCDNPMCSCDPCGCDHCTCGVARVGDLERRVMTILWEQGGDEMTGRQVADALPENAYTTVATVLDRLVHNAHRLELSGESIRRVKAEALVRNVTNSGGESHVPAA